jgi:hypothetical protein
MTTTEIAIKNCEENPRNITGTDTIFFILQLVLQNKDNHKVSELLKHINAFSLKLIFLTSLHLTWRIRTQAECVWEEHRQDYKELHNFYTDQEIDRLWNPKNQFGANTMPQ